LAEFRKASDEYNAAARNAIGLVDQGRTEEAVVLLHGPGMQLGEALGKVSQDWIQHNEELATSAGGDLLASVAKARPHPPPAVAAALLLSSILGFLTFRRIVRPIRGLQKEVEAIAGGDFSKDVPFTDARDETGDLARAVGVLKEGAMAREQAERRLQETERFF